MGYPELRGEPEGFDGELRRIDAREHRVGPILAGLGLAGWGVVALAVRWIWSGYDGDSDVLLIGLVSWSLAAVATVLVGGAASVTLCVVGGALSLGRLIRGRVADRGAILGLLAAALGIAPVVLIVILICMG